MKKIVLSIILIALVMLSSISLLGCGSDNGGMAVAKATESMLEKYGTGGYISVTIDVDKVKDPSLTREEDKSYIFEQVYYPYLAFSSTLLFNVYKRNNFGDNAFKKFTKEQNEALLGRLNDANNALGNLSHSIEIYENSSGNLGYIEVLNNYNIVIDRFYRLNTFYADIYFPSEGFRIQSVTDLSSTGSMLNDYLLYIMCYMSKASFEYEVVNYAYANPIGDITEWLARSYYTQTTILTTSPTMSRVKQNVDVSLVIAGSVKASLLSVLKNIDSDRGVFLYNYNSFLTARRQIDLQAYLSLETSAEREEYLNRCSALTQSRFNMVFNFLDHDFNAMLNAMDGVSTYINA